MNDDRAPTPPPMGGFDALADRIEYIHTEHKSARADQLNTNFAIDKRVSKLEFKDEQFDQRLSAGAATFARLEQQIEKVNAKIDWPWWKVMATIAPAILLIFTWVWQLSRYPDDEKFEALKDDTNLKFEALKSEVMDQKLQLVKADGTLSAIAATQSEVNKKLDAMLMRQLDQNQPNQPSQPRPNQSNQPNPP